ncbi:MAG: DNA gyrase subunit A [Clostridia bacterium]|nr:DNA gyrase subunit A [Clostridia bacterium]MBT7122044.1 DNA gyrase subunit A [Clostridia bacterium]
MEEKRKAIIPINIEKEMKTSFISYAMAVIINRALPDVRDGLKPVHRRILYSMSELGLSSDKPFRKSARIVGDVLGKYHPHGDSSVYMAMVRMAQDFSTRHMLVNGHGNFGSVDGDAPAAMRYTEAKLSKISMELLRDIEKDTVDFYPNFDESLMQPSVLPSKYPNLLVNGTGGIAVGMATNIPPHNLGEAVDAAICLIDNPEASISDLMQYMQGPDFPTGGVIMGTSGITQAYHTGRGKVVVRARAEIDEFKAGRQRIIVTELPYQVNKATLIIKIAELVQDKHIEGISDIRDESDKSGMRVVIELKRDVNANVILNRLYKHTQMRDTFGVIMLALVDGEPKVLNLKQMLYHYLEHQKDVIVRRTKHELAKAQARAHILEGLIIALDNIDEIVEMIKKSPDAPSAKASLIERFVLSEKQAQAILDMRLQRLTGLERDKIVSEYDRIVEKIAYLQSILDTPQMVIDIVKEEMLEVKQKYADERRSEITYVADDIDLDELIQEEEMVVTLTHFGYVKRLKSDTYRTQRRGGRGITGMSTREEDFAEHVMVTSTHSHLLFFTNKGKVFRRKCYELPETSRTAKGTAIVNLLQLDAGEKVSEVFPISEFSEDAMLVIATKNGFIKKTSVSAFKNIRQTGLIAIGLREDDELIEVLETSGSDELIVGTQQGMSVKFAESDVRDMGRTAMGVKSVTLREGDSVVAVDIVRENSEVLVITENGFGKRTSVDEYKIQKRGGIGIKTLKRTDKTGDLCTLGVVDGSEDIILINDAGIIIRMKVDEISTYGRDTQGVKLMNVGEEAKVVSVAIVPPEDIDDESEQDGKQDAQSEDKTDEPAAQSEPQSEKEEK